MNYTPIDDIMKAQIKRCDELEKERDYVRKQPDTAHAHITLDSELDRALRLARLEGALEEHRRFMHWAIRGVW